MTSLHAPVMRAADPSDGLPRMTLPPNSASDSTGAIGLGQPNGERTLRLLVFTSLYPNAAQPRHGVFVEERLRNLVGSGRIAATVVAPVPWFPFGHRRFGAYATFARVPTHEERHGIRILHPRYPVIPKLGMNVAPALMARALLPTLRKIMAGEESFDLIDAHYFYPDGVAAARLGRALRKPVVITARGSDVNVISRHHKPARQIRWAADQADAVVAVSGALKTRLEALGVDSDRIVTLRNGVDLERFRPLDRMAIRSKLGIGTGPVWLAAGHLVEPKGVHFTLAALAEVPEATLLVAGEGPEESRLRELADRLDVAARVRFLGTIPHGELSRYYNAADVMLLASSREGMPNVVLESLACGTPVIAAPFESATELINAPEAGEVAESRTAGALVRAWWRLERKRLDRAATRRFAERLGWAPVVEAQCALYARVLAARGQIATAGAAP